MNSLIELLPFFFLALFFFFYSIWSRYVYLRVIWVKSFTAWRCRDNTPSTTQSRCCLKSWVSHLPSSWGKIKDTRDNRFLLSAPCFEQVTTLVGWRRGGGGGEGNEAWWWIRTISENQHWTQVRRLEFLCCLISCWARFTARFKCSVTQTPIPVFALSLALRSSELPGIILGFCLHHSGKFSVSHNHLQHQRLLLGR